MSIDISGLDKASLLCALFNNAQVNGYCCEQGGKSLTVEDAGFDRFKDLTVPEARHYLDIHQGNFTGKDIRGRWLEVDLSGSELNLGMYNEHFGSGHAIVERFRISGQHSNMHKDS